MTMVRDHGHMKADVSLPAGRFKAECLKVLDDVAETREPVVITKRGRPVARLVPADAPAPLFGAFAASIARYDDLVSPIDEEWDAAR